MSTQEPFHPERRVNYPPWIVTFADLMSLLMTFFVLLFTTATVDEEQYRQVADAMEKAFGPGASRTVIELAKEKVSREQTVGTETSALAQRFKDALSTEIGQGKLAVETRDRQVVLRFPEHIAFQSGSDALSPGFDAVIGKTIEILSKTDGKIVVVGHTDNVPIINERFRSNWDLSAARAVSVIHALKSRVALDPARLVAQGVADTQPLVANDNPANRAQNRRVEIQLLDRQSVTK